MNNYIKPIYISGALLLLSSCANEEIPMGKEVGGERIIFRTSLPQVVSRAEILLKEKDLPYFRVTAFNPADEELVSENVLTEHFKYKRIDVLESTDKYSSEECLWPAQGRESDEVTFFAFYPELYDGADLENKTTVAGSTVNFDYKLTDFKVKSEIREQVDFVTAYTTGNMAAHQFSGISLPFQHQLSRIEVKAWSKNQSCNIEIAGVRIGGAGVKGTFTFKPQPNSGEWDAPSERGIVEYIFGEDDEIVKLHKGVAATSSEAGAVSIMGSKIGDEENCAMLIPYDNYAAWDHAKDRNNAAENMYISVLLRVEDVTETAGVNPKNPQRFPYTDLSQGADALDIERVCLAVKKASGKVIKMVYMKEGKYYEDEGCTSLYSPDDDEEVKEFGWAAVPVSGNWAPGNIYTYILDYSTGVGLHDPEVTTTSPAAGDPIISDKVGFSYKVKEWNVGGGSEFIVPGS